MLQYPWYSHVLHKMLMLIEPLEVAIVISSHDSTACHHWAFVYVECSNRCFIECFLSVCRSFLAFWGVLLAVSKTEEYFLYCLIENMS